MPAASMGTIARGLIPFIIIQVTGLMLITYIPAISLWLPGLLR